MNRPSLLTVSPQGEAYEFVLDADRLTLGRHSSNEIVIRSDSASRQHAELSIEDGVARVRDLGSTNGTYLNGLQIHGDWTEMPDASALQIGDVALRYVAGSGHDEQETTTRPLTDPTGSESPGQAAAETLLMDQTFTEGVSDRPQGSLRIIVRHHCARMTVRDATGTFDVPLDGDGFLIGRDPSCTITISDPMASGRHAQLDRISSGDFLLRDLSSTNGLFVNGIRMAEHVLAEGDTVRIGNSSLTYSDAGAGAPAEPLRRRPVVLLPGFAGSELWLAEEQLWPNTRRMVATSEQQLLDDWNQELRVGQAIREIAIIPGLSRTDSFGRLVDFLRAELGYRFGIDLLEASYDWRQDNRQTAADLAERVSSWRATRPDPTERITLLCHSMGGLVARHYMQRYGTDAIERCLYLGTPHQGSAVSLLAILAGGGMLPFGLTVRKFHRLAMEFTSLFQLLPSYEAARWEDGSPFSPLDDADDSWLAPAYHGKLAAAREMHTTLADSESLPLPGTCIFGYGQKTLASINLRKSNGQIEIIDQVYDTDGDGVVTEISAIIRDAEVHPVRQQHGALFSDADVLRRIRYELVERGIR